jgi:hypothetical protein
MTKENDERFDRAVAALDSVVAQTTSMSPGYEDGLVAGMMDFLHGWFADESYRAIKRLLQAPTNMTSAGDTEYSCLHLWIITFGGKRPSTTFGFRRASNHERGHRKDYEPICHCPHCKNHFGRANRSRPNGAGFCDLARHFPMAVGIRKAGKPRTVRSTPNTF